MAFPSYDGIDIITTTDSFIEGSGIKIEQTIGMVMGEGNGHTLYGRDGILYKIISLNLKLEYICFPPLTRCAHHALEQEEMLLLA